jgi:hypothetical protein
MSHGKQAPAQRIPDQDFTDKDFQRAVFAATLYQEPRR